MQKASLLCPFCLNRAELVGGKQVYPHRPDLYALKFWLCESCDAYIGCHKEGARFKVGNTHYTSDGTAALGTLADEKTRKVRKLVHAKFDPLWKSKTMDRNSAYAALADRMGLTRDECHIGMFSARQCEEALLAIEYIVSTL